MCVSIVLGNVYFNAGCEFFERILKLDYACISTSTVSLCTPFHCCVLSIILQISTFQSLLEVIDLLEDAKV